MDGTEWKNSSGDDSSVVSASGSGQSVKPRRRTLVERELETSLTSKVTSPSVARDGGASVSRYGRARRAKTDDEFYDTDQAVAKLLQTPNESPTKTVYKMYASNSPVRHEMAQTNSATKSTEKIVISSLSPKTGSITPKSDKVYIQKDMIQNDPAVLVKNMFSPSKSNSHLNNILERSSTYNLDSDVQKSSKNFKTSEKKNSAKKSDKSTEKLTINSTKKLESSEKHTINVTPSSSYADTSSVVKTLDFDTGKKKNQDDVKSLPSKSELFETEAKCAFQVGDLAWARVGTYPFWPCIITREPFSELFVKKKLFGRVERSILHVTFFADNGRRGWVVENMLRMYTGIQEFEATRDNFTAEDKKKDPRLYAAFFVSDKKKEIWNKSVEEAELFLREPKRLRIDILRDMLSKNKNVKVVKKPKSVKVARTDSDVSLSESLYDTLFSEDDSKTEEDPRRSRNKSLDVSEVVTACLDNMAAKTGIPIIQKQSHMDRWLQKAKSKTPEKPQSLTPNKLNLSLKTKKTPVKEKRKKDSKNLKAYNVEHDYTKNDIENENPVTNTIAVHVEYSEQINGIQVENNVSKAPYDIETSIVDEVMETDDEKDKEYQEKMDVDEPDTTTHKVHEDKIQLKDLDYDTSNASKVARIDSCQADVSMEDATNMISVTDRAKSDAKINDLIKNLDNDEELLSQAYDVTFEESKKPTDKSVANVNSVKNLKDNTEELLSQAYEPDISFLESKKAINDSKPSNSKSTYCVDLTASEEDTNEINNDAKSTAKKSKKKSKSKSKSTKTPDSKNLSNSVPEEFDKTNISLEGSTPKNNKSSKNRKSYDKVTPTVTKRDNRPKRKHAKYAYTIGGTDDPEFLIYFEMHKDTIMDEIPDLREEDLTKYLYKTWCYERDIKSNLLMEDTDDDDVEFVNQTLGGKEKEDINEKVHEGKDIEIMKEVQITVIEDKETKEEKLSVFNEMKELVNNKVDKPPTQLEEIVEVPDVEKHVHKSEKVHVIKEIEDQVPKTKENKETIVDTHPDSNKMKAMVVSEVTEPLTQIEKIIEVPDVEEHNLRKSEKVLVIKEIEDKVPKTNKNKERKEEPLPCINVNKVRTENKVLEPAAKVEEIIEVPEVKENYIMNAEKDPVIDEIEDKIPNTKENIEVELPGINEKELRKENKVRALKTQVEEIIELPGDKDYKKDHVTEPIANFQEKSINHENKTMETTIEASAINQIIVPSKEAIDKNKKKEKVVEPQAKAEEEKAAKINITPITIVDEDDDLVDFQEPEHEKPSNQNEESILNLQEDLQFSTAKTTVESILQAEVKLLESTEKYFKNDALNKTKTTIEEIDTTEEKVEIKNVEATSNKSVINDTIKTTKEEITDEQPNITREDLKKDEVLMTSKPTVEVTKKGTKLRMPKVALVRENLQEKLIATKTTKIKIPTNMAKLKKRKREVKVSLVRENLEEKILWKQKYTDEKSTEETLHIDQTLQSKNIPDNKKNGDDLLKTVDIIKNDINEATKLYDNKLISEEDKTIKTKDRQPLTTPYYTDIDFELAVPKAIIAKTSTVAVESKKSESRKKGEKMLNTILKLMKPIQTTPSNIKVIDASIKNAFKSNKNSINNSLVQEETIKSAQIQDTEVIEDLVNLTEEEEDDDDDIPSPEFEVHTVDSKEKEFISELKKTIVPELLKDPYYVHIKTEAVDPCKERESVQKSSNTIELKSKELKNQATTIPENCAKLPGNDSKNNMNIDDDESLDSFTEDALLQSDDEDANDSRIHFESIAEEKTSEMDISRTDITKLVDSHKFKTNECIKTTENNSIKTSETKASDGVINGEVKNPKQNRVVSMDEDEPIGPAINITKSKLSLKKSHDKTPSDYSNDKSETIANITVTKADKKTENSKTNVKARVNGCVKQTKLTEIVTKPITVANVTTTLDDKSPKLNGYLHKNKEIIENGIKHNEDKLSKQKRKLRPKDKNKKAYNAFDDPDFMVYVESRQDAVWDENPGLSEEEVIQYLHKTWMYEQELKSDRQKDDDVEQSKLVKGLINQYISKPKKVKRKTSIPIVRIERMDLAGKKDAIVDVPNGMADSDSDCEVVSNGNLIDTISILSEKDSSSEYVPSDDESTSSLDIDDEKSLAKIKAEICKVQPVEKITEVNNVSETVETKPGMTLENNVTVPEINIKNVAAKSEKTGETTNTIPKVDDNIEPIAKEDLITLEDLNVEERKPDLDLSSSLKSDTSEETGRPKRKQRIKTERNPDFPTVREVNSALDDPDFLKYLELRQDALIDENPHVTQDDIVKYLYKTWVYEQNLKTETEKIDEIEQSNLIKGQNDQPAQPKKIRKKLKQEKEREFKIEKSKEKDIEDLPTKEKSRRRATKTFYHEDDTDVEEELEVFEIFKTKKTKTDIKSEVKTEQKTDTTTDEIKTDTPEEEVEDLDDIEAYFLKLTEPKANLFKGLSREHVCEICFKTGRLVKCKGLCGGTFHEDCVKNENLKGEEPQPSSRGRKKKKNRTYPWLRHEGKNLDDSQSDKEIIIEEPELMVIDADEFEAKLTAKMKEVLNVEEVIEIESSSDDEITWKETKPGHCEIIDVKLKLKKSNNYDDFKCNNCINHDTPICFVCKSDKSPKNNTKLRQKCQFSHCHKYYHIECLDFWPQTQTVESKDNTELTCPRHVCHTCVSDDPRGCKTRFSADKLAKCVKCPATYHSFTKCLPAGSKILSASHIICPRHYETKPGKVPCHVNTGWCFICAEGGTLICCEYCPTAFHAECLQIKPPDGNYMCEDCETGRLPLYGEMVWVKLGHYRWWPGIVLHPAEIPDNIKAIKHSHGEFVVRFFGQYDHYWVNRGRVFPFQEGDSGRISSQKSKIDEAFTVAIEHASRAFEILKKAPPNEEEDTDLQSSLLPPHYVKLRVNKPVGSLINKKVEDLNSLTQCECDPRDTDPCGVDSQCLNRMLLTECGPTCLAGDRCHNRMFEKRQYPRLAPHKAAHRGWGLRTLEDIPAGRFIIEYVGELVDEAEFQRRMRSKHEARDENYYFLTLDKDRVIDAGPKGNLARFMNHSCEPNCETQKWTVLGDVRVGLFAIYDIPANSELTFNYNLECTGIEKKRCMCGAKRCSGYIGAKPKALEETQPKKSKPIQKRTYKKRKVEESPPIKKVAKPRTTMRSRPKELTEIEKDLLIIKNATNGISSDSENSSRLNSLEKEEKKALKRKTVSFSADEVILYNSDSSPLVKKVKTDDSDSVSLNGVSVNSVSASES